MAASISTKSKNVAGEFLKRSAGLITGVAGDYISEAMPVTTSTLREASSTIASASSTLSNTMQRVMPNIRQFKLQSGVRSVFNWFMESEDSFNDSAFDESQLEFDVDTDNSEIAEAQIGEAEASANKVSKALIESSHQMLEGQMYLTANIKTSIDSQTAVISSGFDRTNETLNKILEVVTKNTATLIETTVAASQSNDTDRSNMVVNGKFSFSEYKKVIADNIKKNPEMGMAASFLPVLTDPSMMKTFFTPQNIVGMLFSGVMNKKAPNLKKNMEALDSAVNDTIMTSLIRLGEKQGTLGKILGLDSSRQEISGSKRSTLELKAVPFDSLTREAITSTIPGYLKQILAALGGKNVTYDYKNRTFKTQQEMEKDFQDVATSKGNLSRASSRVRSAIGNDQFGGMIYDLMMTDLGSKTKNGQARNIIESFSDPKKFEEYIRDTILKANGVTASAEEMKRIGQMGRNISAQHSNNIGIDISNQVASTNVNRNRRIGAAIREGEAYNMDMSEFATSVGKELRNILDANGRRRGHGAQDQLEGESAQNSSSTIGAQPIAQDQLEGVNYTNKALYEIFRLMNRGINVFQVGSSKSQTSPYKTRKEFLPPPKTHKPKTDSSPLPNSNGPRPNAIASIAGGGQDGDPNLLQNQQLEDGTTEDLTKGQRFARWGKARGGALAHAMFSGDPDQVRDAFGAIIKDVTQVAGDQVKQGASKINQQFGNVTGYLKHKLFGTGYSYTDENGKKVEVADNEKGGAFGFVKDYVKDMFKGTKDKAKNWFQTVAGYFDYGDGNDKEGKTVKQKRHKLLATSVGAFAGAGLLGGPIGLIMGAVAGNALSGMDIGGKIKDIFIGRDENGKAKGLLTRLADGVMDPIKFQLGKTAEHMGNLMKKNILGPLSDIGFAIKDRITNAASSTFGKVFGFVGKMLMAPFKGLTKIAKAPINLLGSLVRGTSSAASGAVGMGLSSIASSLVKSDEGKEALKQRRKDRKIDIKQSTSKWELDDEGKVVRDENGKKVLNQNRSKYSSYKEWKEAENARRAEWGSKFKDYVSEREKTPEEIAAEEAARQAAEDAAKIKENSEKQVEQGAQISEDLHGLAQEGLTEGSIFTHDKGLHDRIDRIIEIIGDHFAGSTNRRSRRKSSVKSSETSAGPATVVDEGSSASGLEMPKINLSGIAGSKAEGADEKPSAAAQMDSTPEETQDHDNNFANSILSAAVPAATIGGLDDTDTRTLGQLASEGAKEKSNKGVMLAKFKDILGGQKVKAEEKKDESKGFFSKIISGIGGIFGKVGDVVDRLGLVKTAILGLFAGKEIKSFWDNVVKGDMDFAQWFGEESMIGKAVQGLMSVSKFVGKVGGTIVNAMSRGIETVTGMVPFMPTISPPQIDTDGPFAGIATGILGGLYMKGIGAIGSIASAAANIINAGSNAIGNLTGGKGGKGLSMLGGNGYGSGLAGLAADGLGVYLMAKSYINPDTHEHTDAAGNEIQDETSNRVKRNWGKRAIANRTIQGLASHAGNLMAQGGKNAAKLAEAGITTSINKAGTATFKNASGRFVSNAALETATGVAGKEVRDVATKTGMTGLTTAQRIAASNADDVAKAAGKAAASNVDDVAKAAGKAAVSGADDVAKSKGAMGFITKALNGIKNFLMKNKTFAKFATAISSKIDDILLKVAKGGEKIISKMPDKVAAIITKGGTKEAGAVATAGIGYAVMAFGGALSGGLSAANIFGVRESDVNAKMRTVASVIVAMLNAVPGLWALELLDLILQPLMGTTIRSILCSLLYSLLGGSEDLEEKRATFAADVSAYNEKYGAEVSTTEYNDMVNKTMGAKIFGKGAVKTDSEGRAMFDDAGEALRTNHGIAGWFSSGEKEYARDADGNIARDSKGKAIQAVDAKGHKMYKEGEKKWTAYVGDAFHDIGGFFAGKTVYETDEQGRALVDENGNFIVKEKGQNVFKRAGSAISSGWNKAKTAVGGAFSKAKSAVGGAFSKVGGFFGLGKKKGEEESEETKKDSEKLKSDISGLAKKATGLVSSFFKNPIKTVSDGISKLKDENAEYDENGNKITDKKSGFFSKVTGALGKTASALMNPVGTAIKAVKSISDNKDEVDENGNPLTDADGNPIKKGGLGSVVKGAFGKLSGGISKITGGVGAAIKSITDSKTETDENGEPLKDADGNPVKKGGLGSLFKKVAGGLGGAFTKITGQVSSTIKEWDANKEEVGEDGKPILDANGKPLKKGGLKGFITGGLGSIFKAITNPLKEMEDGVKEYDQKDSEWKKEGKTSIKDLVKSKLGSFWSGITNGIKGLAAGGDESNPVASVGGVGGPVGPDSSQFFAMRTLDDGGGGSATTTSTAATPSKGGNPLNKAFKITSKYGPRNLTGSTEVHRGVDIVPSDGTAQAEVSARYSGTISNVVSNLPDSHTGLGVTNNQAGNNVTIQTDDGMQVKMMHLKANSIPSSIKKGARVNIGDKIGDMGTTGRSTGPHLHYQLERYNASTGQYEHFDPTADISGQPNAVTNYGDTPYSSMPDTDTNTGETAEKKGFLAQLLDKIKELGSAFLNKITGGLFGTSGSSDTSTFSSSSDGNYDTYSDALTGDEYQKWINVIKEVKRQIAQQKKGYVYGGNVMDISVNGFTRKYRTDCSGLVSHCVSCYLHKNIGVTSRTLLGDVPELKAGGFVKLPWPGWDKLQMGDIISKAGHTEIFYGNNGSTHLVWNCGGDASCNDPNPTKDSCAAYEVVWRLAKSTASANAAYAGAANVGQGAEDLWKYFKGLGYSDEAVAGVLGCWTAESGNKSKRVEWDYSNSFKEMLGYDKVLNDRTAMDNFTRALFNQYASQGKSINQQGYKASDGHLYPGIGYAQWTGPRGKALLDFARQNNMDWGSAATQLAYLDTELKGGYASVRNKIQNVTTPEEATQIFCSKFEGYNQADGIAKRQNYARGLYNNLKGKYPTGSAIGGPIISAYKGSNPWFGGPTENPETLNPLLASLDEMALKDDKPQGEKDNVKASKADLAGVPQMDEMVKELTNTEQMSTLAGPSDTSAQPSAHEAPKVGGPSDELDIDAGNSSLGDSSYKSTTPRIPKNVGGPAISSATSTSAPAPAPVVRVPTPKTSTAPIPQANLNQTDLTGVMNAMYKVIEELGKITNNTASSVDLLGTLNDKDFVDQGLRDSINALGNSHSKSYGKPSTRSSAQSVSRMAKP